MSDPNKHWIFPDDSSGGKLTRHLDKTLKNYEILTTKQGGMASIYIVHDKDNNTKYAVKTFLDKFFQDEEIVKRFYREARIWVELEEHPNIVMAHHVEDIEGKPFIFLEYVEGKDLKNFIKALIQEMCHRYSFVKVGCDSGDIVSPEEFLTWSCVSWYRIKMQYLRGLHEDNAEVLEQNGVTADKINNAEKEIDGIEREFKKAAKRFFDGDASDLILTFEEE